MMYSIEPLYTTLTFETLWTSTAASSLRTFALSGSLSRSLPLSLTPSFHPFPRVSVLWRLYVESAVAGVSISLDLAAGPPASAMRPCPLSAASSSATLFLFSLRVSCSVGSGEDVIRNGSDVKRSADAADSGDAAEIGENMSSDHLCAQFAVEIIGRGSSNPNPLSARENTSVGGVSNAIACRGVSFASSTALCLLLAPCSAGSGVAADSGGNTCSAGISNGSACVSFASSTAGTAPAGASRVAFSAAAR